MARLPKPPIDATRFYRIRAAVLQAKQKRDHYGITLAIKYGSGHRPEWYSTAERKQLDRLHKAYDRACTRIYALLDRSPRNWRSGVPTTWVCEQLSYSDAIRPRLEPLSVIPPLAYGCTEPMR